MAALQLLLPKRSFQIYPNILQGMFARPYVLAPLYCKHHIRMLHSPTRLAAIRRPILSSSPSFSFRPNPTSIRFITSSNFNPNSLQTIIKSLKNITIGGGIFAVALIIFAPFSLVLGAGFGYFIYRYLKNSIDKASHFPSQPSVLFPNFGQTRPGHSRDPNSPALNIFELIGQSDADLLREKTIVSISDAFISGNRDLIENLGFSTDISSLQFAEIHSVSSSTLGVFLGPSIAEMTIEFSLSTPNGQNGTVVAKGERRNGIMEVKEIEVFWGPTLKTQIPLRSDLDMNKKKRQGKVIEGEFHDIV